MGLDMKDWMLIRGVWIGFCLEKLAAMQEHGLRVYINGTWVGGSSFLSSFFLLSSLFSTSYDLVNISPPDPVLVHPLSPPPWTLSTSIDIAVALRICISFFLLLYLCRLFLIAASCFSVASSSFLSRPTYRDWY